MDEASRLTGTVASAIGWFYLVTNSARAFTYIPQIIAVWRCRDGARAISLLTWCSWAVSHIAAIAYGVLIVHDLLFVVISTINLTGCLTVTVLAVRRRRGLLSAAAAVDAGLEPPVAPLLSPRYPSRPRSFAMLPRRRVMRNAATARTWPAQPMPALVCHSNHRARSITGISACASSACGAPALLEEAAEPPRR